MAAAQRIYARALFDAAHGREGRRGRPRPRRVPEALEGSPELAAFLGNPQVETAAKIDVVASLRTAQTSSCGTRSGCWRRRVARARLRRCTRSSAASSTARRQSYGRADNRHELSDDEARSLVGKIEHASGRTVEATRNVDPS